MAEDPRSQDTGVGPCIVFEKNQPYGVEPIRIKIVAFPPAATGFPRRNAMELAAVRPLLKDGLE
jgi:hypothetical protein